MRYGLVFAGGGAKGSYEIGVWRAVESMGFEIGAVTGVSIGSVNGAMFVQGELDRAQSMWEKIKLSDIVAIDGANTENLFSVQNVVTIISEIYKNQGMDMSPLENILRQVIDEDKIRKRNIDFGLATYSLTDMCETELFLSDIPEGHLIEYIMASACLPGFQKRKIGNKEFIDGAVNNNMPVNMLLEKGYKDIIAVDVGGIGIVKRVVDIGANIVNIKCSDNIIGTMEFEETAIKRSIKTGYYDTYKAFGRLCGDRYYFNTVSYYNAKRRYSDDMLKNIEAAGAAFGIEKNAAYNIDDFINGILAGYVSADAAYRKAVCENQNIFDLITKTKLDDSVITAWIVDMMKNNVDFMSNKLVMNILGENLDAASGVLYFLGK